MSDSNSDSGGDERGADPHLLFFASQNKDADEETRQQTVEKLRELGAGNVHVPPPVPVIPSKKRVRDDTGETESQPHKKSKQSTSGESASQPTIESQEPATLTVTGDVSKAPRDRTVPANAEIIVISDNSDDGNTPVEATVRSRTVQK
ncbi:hypothetical protein Daus18300_007625 [Diaporthe australafricana]|uniref:Uncharacterized protein n=1 Tax=Diaporthe australafricana TaxID=127596 RepID=A0ABR3WM79_9PEZI